MSFRSVFILRNDWSSDVRKFPNSPTNYFCQQDVTSLAHTKLQTRRKRLFWQRFKPRPGWSVIEDVQVQRCAESEEEWTMVEAQAFRSDHRTGK